MPPSESGPATKRKRLRNSDRRAQIIAAAREVFVEQGLNGSRSRLIAERAGITEAYLYRLFHSKDEIYRLAVEAPLTDLIESLKVETHELAQREDVKRADVLLRFHELLLGCMVEVAPLIAAALLSESEFYADYLFPSLRAALTSIIPDITGRPLRDFELDLFVEATIGIHLTLSLEALFDSRPVDVKGAAKQITAMFAPGVARSQASSHSNGRRSRSTKAAPAKR
ncbi:MAG TPA: TetR/AcrR family transcriptional regulator [Acidimicrobiales bacterium]|nr:TetR/AcrR family transcriptional regulator [Acidimicrobiales bacterium]